MTTRAPRPSPKLVEGVDYYMEAGKLVFSSTYHLKRGYCCNSRCRHCPYGTFGPPNYSAELRGKLPTVVGPAVVGPSAARRRAGEPDDE